MKSCGRTLRTGEKCGTLFEGSGSYCRVCRNEYMKDYHRARKEKPLDAPRAALPGVSCEVCAEALRNNTINRESIGDDEVILCNTCKAVFKYLTSELNEAQAETLIGLAVDLNELPGGVSAGRAVTQEYRPQVLKPGSVEVCGYCEDQARPGKAFCEKHKDMEEDYQNSYAARLSRGEKL